MATLTNQQQPHERVTAAVDDLAVLTVMTVLALRASVTLMTTEAEKNAAEDPRRTILGRWTAVNEIVERGRSVIDAELQYVEDQATELAAEAKDELSGIRSGDAMERTARAAILVPSLRAAIEHPEAVGRILRKAWPDALDRRIVLDAIDNLVLTIPDHLIPAVENVVAETKRELKRSLPVAEGAIEDGLERIETIGQYISAARWWFHRELTRLETLLEHPAPDLNSVPLDEVAIKRHRRCSEARHELNNTLLMGPSTELFIRQFESTVTLPEPIA